MSSNSPRYWVGTSWKMNKLLADSIAYSEQLLAVHEDWDGQIRPFVVPPYTTARQVKAKLANTNIMVGAQNMHWENAGAWTGEISPAMLRDCQLDMVELGHSERRTYFGETDEAVGLKVRAALQHDLLPLICIGETQAEHASGHTQQVLERQISGALEHVTPDLCRSSVPLLFAYEPVWAIGDAGTPATAEYANLQHQLVSKLSERILGVKVPCLYGGSVDLTNCKEFLCCEFVSGLFIGRAAWQVENYLKILDLCRKTL